jgi:hypothetical protein
MAVVMAALCLHPNEDIATDSVDLIEVNHFYDEQGRLVFDQIIFYDWCPIFCRYNVRDWRLLKSTAQIPHRNWQQGYFVTVWHDGEVLREVKSLSLRESWTQYDPELLEREFLPKEQRRELRKTILVAGPAR